MNNEISFIEQNIVFRRALNELSTELNNSLTLTQTILCALKYSLQFSVMIVEETLNRRAKPMDERRVCPECGTKLESKGFEPRQIRSIIGVIRWLRRIWRCPKGCKIGQVAPFDEILGIGPNQKISDEIKQMACLLAVFVPYKIAAMLMMSLTGIEVSSTSIWDWVQIFGNKAISKLEKELKLLADGQSPSRAQIDEKISKLIMAIGADGVMVPFRPNGGSPDGKAVWREVKIGIFARLGEKLTKKNKKVKVIVRKRVVAVLGKIGEFKSRMMLMAAKEGFHEAKTVVWLSDGGKGYWGVFNEIFSGKAHGVLDFYHAVQNVWKGAKAWLDGRTNRARKWFAEARRKIRKGKVSQTLKDLKEKSLLAEISDDDRKTLENLVLYLETHKKHMDYDKFEALGLPIGSGMVESTCKWLIQQRFKGVGMRWSEKGFGSLLHLRLEWVNEEFDGLFSASPNS